MSYRWQRQKTAFTLIEVVIALGIFLIMTLMFAAVIPTATRSVKQGNYYNMAVVLAQHKIDQVLEAGYSRVDSASLESLQIIDNSPAQLGPNYSYTFTGRDNLQKFFPGNATGTVAISNYTPSWDAVHGEHTLRQVTVTITWKEPGKAPSRYTISTLLTKMVHN